MRFLCVSTHTSYVRDTTACHMKVLIDLFCGLGGASSAFTGTDWRVIRIDNNPELLDHVKGMWLLDMNDPKNVLDVIRAHLYDVNLERLVVWASPPCTEFSTNNVDFNLAREEETFELGLLNNTVWLIDELNHHYNLTDWFIENVRGAVSTFNEELGHYNQRIGPFFLWGQFVPIACLDADVHRHRKPFNKTNSRTPLRSNIHAQIPYALSESVRESLDRQLSLARWVE